MGCDIHAYGEIKKGDSWESLDNFIVDEYGDFCVPYKEKAYTGRNYTLFGVIAGVRRPELQQFEEKGLPEDVSKNVKNESDSWGYDGHSHSFLTMEEIMNINLKNVPISGMKQKDELRAFMEELKKDSPDYSLLYPYCQGTNRTDYESFEVQIPLEFLVSGFIEVIKKYFVKKTSEDFVEKNKDNLRLVFWFDN